MYGPEAWFLFLTGWIVLSGVKQLNPIKNLIFRTIGREEGFGLLDVLFANFFITLGLCQLALVLFFGLKQIETANTRIEATNYARSVVEEVLAAKYYDVVDEERVYGSIEEYPELRLLIFVREDTPIAFVKTVRVVVLWRISATQESTRDGHEFDPSNPDTHRALVEFTTLKYRFN
jgi:hypothetical protein